MTHRDYSPTLKTRNEIAFQVQREKEFIIKLKSPERFYQQNQTNNIPKQIIINPQPDRNIASKQTMIRQLKSNLNQLSEQQRQQKQTDFYRQLEISQEALKIKSEQQKLFSLKMRENKNLLRTEKILAEQQKAQQEKYNRLKQREEQVKAEKDLKIQQIQIQSMQKELQKLKCSRKQIM
ncbi:Hypothetical_protein [Hexamita inflata]|uniref:Hypothetical_protein n=1 Tax=Hexamita inflata TaxID=28002 RepID=A0AA86UAP5_9EUKA|nr:Hypothetical protein HINF_LOCUS9286 [Hexamita inflata]CAI9950215.1 Hypothetical protein HINF_LOCUS37860 [Hexamita inflata]